MRRTGAKKDVEGAETEDGRYRAVVSGGQGNQRCKFASCHDCRHGYYTEDANHFFTCCCVSSRGRLVPMACADRYCDEQGWNGRRDYLKILLMYVTSGYVIGTVTPNQSLATCTRQVGVLA